MASFALIALLLSVWLHGGNGYLRRPNSSRGVVTAALRSRTRSRQQLSMLSNAKATLDGSTLWRLSLKLEKPGSKSVEAIARVRFVEDRGYEPPQGRIFVEDDYYGIIRVDEKGYTSRWTLSEDKNDRKDGLWVWGLFEEPKYPFLYFSLGIFKSILLPSGAEEPIFGGEGVPGDRLDVRFSHVRDDIKGAVLSDGEMTYTVKELVKADILGLGGDVNVGEPTVAGSISIRPVLSQDTEDEQLTQSISKNMNGGQTS